MTRNLWLKRLKVCSDKKGRPNSQVVVVPIVLVPCPLDWGTLVGIPRLLLPGLLLPKASVPNFGWGTLVGTGYPSFTFLCAHRG